MSARLFNCFTDAQDKAIFSAIGLRELHAIMDMDPLSTNHYWFDTYLTKRTQEREEHVARLQYKYNYLICQMMWTLSGPQHCYERKQVGLPEDHIIMFEEAILWYQLSQQYYIEHDISVPCPDKLFLKKWLELYPCHANHLTVLKAELLLSNQAFNALSLLQERRRIGAHSEQMDILYLTKVELLEELIPSLSDIESLGGMILGNCIDDLTD
jgi:hypothetical protein